MKKNKYLISLIIFLFIIIVLFFFYYKYFSKKNSNSFGDYKYGIIHTSIKKDESTISIYDYNGTYIDEVKIDVGGILSGSFLKHGINNNDKFYLGSPILGNKPQNFILEIDKKSLNYNKIGNENTITPTFFSIDDKFAYLSVSLDTTSIYKVDLDKNNTVNSIELEGRGRFSIQKDNKIYLATIINVENKLPFARIYVLDKENFNILNEFEINDVDFVQDMILYNNSLYILVYEDSSGLSNRLIELNLEENSINEIKIPFNYLKKLYVYNDNLLVIQGSRHLRDNTENKIAKINLKTNDISVFETYNKHISTYVDDKFLYSSDSNFIYIYDLFDFKLLEKFKIKEINDEIFVSFFVNE